MDHISCRLEAIKTTEVKQEEEEEEEQEQEKRSTSADRILVQERLSALDATSTTQERPRSGRSDRDRGPTETDEPAEDSCCSLTEAMRPDGRIGSAASSCRDSWSGVDKGPDKTSIVTLVGSKDSLTGPVIQEVHRRHELCRRHIHQLFIRGEQIALVAVVPL